MAKSGRKIIKYRRSRFPNIGVILFFTIFCYILLYTISYIYRDKTSVYRVINDVQEEVINSTGVVLRNERIFTSKESGYINHYVARNARVKKNDVVYTIDTTGSIYSKIVADNEKNDESDENIINLIKQFQIKRDDNFYNTYALKESLDEAAMSTSGKLVLTAFNDIINEYGDNSFFNINRADDSGIVVYGIDGLENITADKVTNEIFANENSYVLKVSADADGKVESGSPIYKLITDENWQVAVPISGRQKDLLTDMSYVDVLIDNKKFTARAAVEVITNGAEDYLVLTFYNYMVNYADKRFVNINITLKSISGLKIPKSAVVEKPVFEIPYRYFMYGGGKNTGGFTRIATNNKNETVSQRVEMDICYIDRENELIYVVNDGELKAGDVIIGENSTETFVLSKTKNLKGVYNINKGYPRFKHVEPITDIINNENSEYYLIPEDKGYYIHEYDNIVLNAAKLFEE